ncbi:hypothetical protein ACFVDQ_30755 [Streptomyces sp. NPDC057684]|uniref:hypothetical protein n=1 Tax=Streptomyces sp. NPDC057684 TaxID=3346211 RepID=UPI0036BCB470
MLERLHRLSDEAGVTITAGVPLTVVSKTLRHSTLSTTSLPSANDPAGPDGGRSTSWATRRTTPRLCTVSCDATASKR